MSIQKKPEYASYEITEQNVIDFLGEHPDFFDNNEETLLKLKISHNTGGPVSILEYQIDRLREQNSSIRAKLIDLINIARENDKLAGRIHQLILSLVNATSIDNVIQILEEAFSREFNAQWVSVFLFKDRNPGEIARQDVLTERDDQVKRHFENFFKANRPLCGRLKKAQLGFLFGEHAEEVGSAVLIPIGSHAKTGMIAIASENEKRFHSSMGTIYLSQMGENISQTISRFIE